MMDDLNVRQEAVDQLAGALMDRGVTVALGDARPEVTVTYRPRDRGDDVTMTIRTKKFRDGDGWRLYFVEAPGYLMCPVDNIGNAARFVQHMMT
jgi:hypothetical protein